VRSRWGGSLGIIAVLAVGTLSCGPPPEVSEVATGPSVSSPVPRASPDPSIELDGQGTGRRYRPRRPATMVFTFAPAVPPADRSFVEGTIRQARRYFRTHYGPVLRGTIRISVESTLEEAIASYAERLDLPEEFARARWGSEASALTTRGPGNQAVQLFVLVSRWAAASPPQRAKLLLHEWFHVLQYQGPPPTFRPVDPDDAPRWLFEGSAEWWAFLAAADAGWFADFQGVAASQRALASGTDDSLRSQREVVVGVAGYALAFTAVDLLAERTSPRTVVRFWKKLPDAPSPARAFEEVFGLKLRRFYRVFASHRQSGFPR
jgi:hypothetical protein